jgi:hypothetical protein
VNTGIIQPTRQPLATLALAVGLVACGTDSFTPTEASIAGTYTASTFTVISGHSVTFNQSANTFIRDAVFTAGPNTLTTAGTFGDTTLRLVLTKTS